MTDGSFETSLHVDVSSTECSAHWCTFSYLWQRDPCVNAYAVICSGIDRIAPKFIKNAPIVPLNTMTSLKTNETLPFIASCHVWIQRIGYASSKWQRETSKVSCPRMRQLPPNTAVCYLNVWVRIRDINYVSWWHLSCTVDCGRKIHVTSTLPWYGGSVFLMILANFLFAY